MKTKLILGNLALALFMTQQTSAQFSPTSPGGLQVIYNNERVGIKLPTGVLPSQDLDVGNNISIRGTHAVFNSPVGCIDWGSGTTGDLFFRTLATQGNIFTYTDRMAILNGGNVGIGTISPSEKLSVETTVPNDGISITQTAGQASALHMYNTSTGGNHWALFSTGNGNGQGSGNFSIYEYGGGLDRLFINGSSGNVGIGINTPTNARLDVRQDGQASFNRAIYGNAYKTNGNSYWNTGIEGVGGTDDCNGASNTGVRGRAYNGYSTGGWFSAENPAENCNQTAVGVYAYAQGISAVAGVFNGDLVCNGSITGPSDKKLKDNIKPLTNTLDKIKLLKPSTYTYRTNEFKGMKLPVGQQMGLIAQELEQVFPELVKENKAIINKNEKGETMIDIVEHKSVNYISFIPVLIGGIQEQQALIESQLNTINNMKSQLIDQQNQLNDQKQLIDALTQKSSGTTGINSINSVDAGFQMSQNEPNPFTHETVVKYSLPQTVSNAFMAVYDLTGKQITTFPINEKGSSSLTITSEKLAAGIYIYSIVADGKVIDSKRMIVTEK